MTLRLTRRSFLKLGSVLGAASFLDPWNLFSAGLSSCTAAPPQIVFSAGGHNCGGRCMLKLHVQDNIVTRITTDPSETKEHPGLRACLRCRAYRDRLYHPDRLKYPMKRVGKRGEGRFERITWDEAIDLVAGQLTRIRQAYGHESIYCHYATGNSGLLSGGNFIRRLLSMTGGYLNFYNNYSNPCVTWAMNYTYGDQNSGHSPEDWVNSKLIILWGFNPAETIFGTNTMYYLRRAKELGVKIIAIDPRYSDTVVALADEWIPIRPTTDNALMAAMAYVMIQENLQDQAFLDTYCQGFDEARLPPGSAPNSSFKSYVLGQKDGVAKTPAWAAAITGIPETKIIQLAREYALTKPANILSGFGIQRHAYGELPPRGAAALAAMTGNIGKSGGSAGAMGYPGYGRAPRMPGVVVANPVKASIPCFMFTDYILRGAEMTQADGLQGADKLPSNIKMIFNVAGNALLNQHGDINRTAKILADENLVECIVVSEQFLTPSAKFADILLPINTFMERVDMVTPWAWGDYVLFMDKAVDSLYESRSEYQWISMLADRLGVKDRFTADRDEEQWVRYLVAEAAKMNPGFPSYEDFKRQGVYYFPQPAPHIAFREQIVQGKKFNTPSGKIEIFSPALAKMNHPAIPGTPEYVPAWEGPSDPLKQKYPLQCIGHHYRRRVHSTFDNVPWMEEVAPQVCWINPLDAKTRGIQDGDRIKIYNGRGIVTVPAKVTPRIMPGVISLPQGAWYTPDKNGVDRRGSINVLTHHRPTPLAKGNPQHTNLVEVMKA